LPLSRLTTVAIVKTLLVQRNVHYTAFTRVATTLAQVRPVSSPPASAS
jgi:hypothetical protein